MISQKDRTWWKNLRNGAPVRVLLQGHALQARAETFTVPDMAAHILLLILQQVPTYQRLLHVTLNSTGQPENLEVLKQLAQDHVIVRLRELTELAAWDLALR